MKHAIDIEGVRVFGEVSSLPGCPQIAVSHGVFVRPQNRGEGIAKKANAQRLLDVFNMGYDLALCTVSSENEAQKKIMDSNGWKCIESFMSSKTGHEVLLYSKALIGDNK